MNRLRSLRRSSRRWGVVALALGAGLGGGCSGSGSTPDVAAIVEGTEIRASDTEVLLASHATAEAAREGEGIHTGVDGDRQRTLTHFVLQYQIKHALLRHLARGMNVILEPHEGLSPEGEAGRLSHAMAQRLFPDLAAPTGEPPERAAELVDQQRQALFAEWFDKQLRLADIRVDRSFGQWDAGRGVVQ